MRTFIVNKKIKIGYDFYEAGDTVEETVDRNWDKIIKLGLISEKKDVKESLSTEIVDGIEIRRAGPWYKVFKDGEMIGKPTRNEEEAKEIAASA